MRKCINTNTIYWIYVFAIHSTIESGILNQVRIQGHNSIGLTDCIVVYLSVVQMIKKVHAGESANWLLAIAVSAVGSLSLYLGFANVSTILYLSVWGLILSSLYSVSKQIPRGSHFLDKAEK